VVITPQRTQKETPVQDHKNFFELDNQGVVHHLHSDSYNLFMVYEDTEDNRLYVLTLDKDFTIASANEIKTTHPVNTVSFKRWYRPGINALNEVVFRGVLKDNLGEHKFSIIEDTLVLENGSNITETLGFATLQCLKDIEVDCHVQKGNLLYIIGWDSVRSEQVFIETHIAEDKATRRYTLASEKGNLILNTINLDPWSNRIYVGGELVVVNAKTTVSKPYLETFCFHKPPA
jgi:hypothetical protein